MRRYLLNAKVTSDGYERLRQASRLDLTVEALVVRPEFESLFSDAELDRAQQRLSEYTAMPLAPELEPTATLLAVLNEALSAPPETRIMYRDRIASFGRSAIVAAQRSLGKGGSAGFAVAVIEAVGRRADSALAIAALHGIAAADATYRTLADAAIDRITSSAKKPA